MTSYKKDALICPLRNKLLISTSEKTNSKTKIKINDKCAGSHILPSTEDRNVKVKKSIVVFIEPKFSVTLTEEEIPTFVLQQRAELPALCQHQDSCLWEFLQRSHCQPGTANTPTRLCSSGPGRGDQRGAALGADTAFTAKNQRPKGKGPRDHGPVGPTQPPHQHRVRAERPSVLQVKRHRKAEW